MPKIKKSFHTYRFAVFGRVSSGKTAFLASAAATSISSSTGGDIKYAETPPPLVRSGQTLEAETIEIERLKFKQDFQDSIQRLHRKRVPVANPVHPELIPIHKFEVTSNPTEGDVNGRSSFVEIIDYSGEFLDPQQDLQKAATELRAILRNMDGFLIFAETPRPSDPTDTKAVMKANADVAIEVNALSAALSTVFLEDDGAKKQFGRACLLVNKWDRVEDFDFLNLRQDSLKPLVEEQKQKMLNWLETSDAAVGHQKLYNDVKNSLGVENVAIFPVSAFGRFEIGLDDDGEKVETPAVIPLPYLNVVEPIEKLIDIADNADLTIAENAANHRSGFLSRHAFWKIGQKQQGELTATELSFRTEHSYELKQRVRKIVKANRIAKCLRIGSLAATIAIIAVTVQTGLDLHSESRIALCEGAPNIDCTHQTVQFLDRFIAADALPLRTLSKTLVLRDAKDRRSKLIIERDKIWTGLLFTDVDPRVQPTVDNATRYLSLYAEESTAFSKQAVDIGEFDLQYSQVRDWIKRNGKNVQEIRSTVNACASEQQDLGRFTSLLEEVQSDQPKNIVVGQFKGSWNETINELSDISSMLNNAQECQQILAFLNLSQEINSALGAGQELRALELLNEGIDAYTDTAVASDQLTNLVESTYGSLLSQIGNNSPDANDPYDGWLKFYEKNILSIRREFLRGDSYPIISNQMRVFRPRFAVLESQFIEHWDCAHREDVISLVPETFAKAVGSNEPLRLALDEYRTAPHAKNFANDMSRIQSYMNQFDGPLSLKIQVECVDLPSPNENSDTFVNIQVNGRVFDYTEFSYGRSATCGIDSNLTLTVKRNDRIDFSGQIRNNGSRLNLFNETRFYDVIAGQTASVKMLLTSPQNIKVSLNGETGSASVRSNLTNIVPVQALSQGCSIQ